MARDHAGQDKSEPSIEPSDKGDRAVGLGWSATVGQVRADAEHILRDATWPEYEMSVTFGNHTYLRLQMHMDRENRMYTELSNIMKTKHDTVKSTISNVR